MHIYFGEERHNLYHTLYNVNYNTLQKMRTLLKKRTNEKIDTAGI